MIRPTWDEYFMAMAVVAAHRSPDPNTKVGAVVVDQDNIVLGVGYNGFPRGCNDHVLPITAPAKYDYMAHAEANALANCSARPKNGRLYATVQPCNHCAILIVNNQISEVVYLIERPNEAARVIFEQAGVKIRQFEGDLGMFGRSFPVHGKFLYPWREYNA